ncbi:type I secretion target repeat protein [Thalassobium sp. R2A62]|nr:type I secretion target repeat protein [Thalassobium sp. R2A62]
MGAYDTGGTATFSDDGVSVTITDDDSVFEDFGGQNFAETGANAVLTDAVTLDGTTYSAGTQINAIGQVEVINDTSGDAGFAQLVGFGGSALGAIYLAYPFPVSDGDSLTFIATDNNNRVSPDKFGDTQGYAYSEFDGAPDQGSSQPPLVSTPPVPDGSHSTTEIIVSGADVAKSPVVNANSSAGYQGQGQITVNAQSVFQDDDIVVLKVNQVDANGEISPTSNTGLADVTVYDSYADYLAGTVKYNYAPQNPGQTANVQTSLSGLGDGYVNFTSANIMQPQNGGPSFDQLFVAPNSGIGTSGSGTFSTKEQFDFNSDGDFDDFLEDGNTNFLVGNYASPPVCFTRGTLIKTNQGERPIEELAAGDMVLTMDHGYQPIRWIGSSKRAATGDLAPILIRKGALGNDRDLRVSPQHRMLLQGWQAEMLFGELEVLATAKSLVNDHSILRDEGGDVEYFHMLFDTHEIIYAQGCASESFHPGQQGWTALDQATRDEILTLFPQLADGTLNDYGPAARMSLKHKEGKLLGAYMAGSC